MQYDKEYTKDSKLKKILTSRITVGIICFLLGGLFIGGISQKKVQEGDTNSQTKKDNTTEVNLDSKNESKDKTQSGSNLTQMKLGQSYKITTSNGDYNLTIEGIRFTDKRNEFSEKPAKYVIFLDFNYENVSSTEEVYLFDSNFKVIDDQGTILDAYPVDDDARQSKTLPIGTKCKASATYAMPTSSKNLRVLFYDNMYENPSGEVTIETGL